MLQERLDIFQKKALKREKDCQEGVESAKHWENSLRDRNRYDLVYWIQSLEEMSRDELDMYPPSFVEEMLPQIDQQAKKAKAETRIMKKLMARREEFCQDAIDGAIRRLNVVKDLHKRKIQAFQDRLELMIGEQEYEGSSINQSQNQNRLQIDGSQSRLEAANEEMERFTSEIHRKKMEDLYNQDQLERKMRNKEHKTRVREQKERSDLERRIHAAKMERLRRELEEVQCQE
uniref:Uncharacterized protein n=1 Tax=Caenorhabditis tropicalis TaxID=1561998 RepID=A0A1I7URV4_9PELO